MKPKDQFQVQLIRSKLPYLSKNLFPMGESQNHSLKKIFQNNNHNSSLSSNNVAMLPKLRHKSKHNQMYNKKNNDSSSEKNQAKWYLANNNSKKRQKLHTQGLTSQSFTQMEDSFISLTNKIMVIEQDGKDTMIDFRKKIQQNKLIIKKQVEKKNKQNQSSAKREKSLIKKKRVNSSKVIQLSPGNHFNSSKGTIETTLNKSKFQMSIIKERSSSKKDKNKQQRKRQKTKIQQSQKSSQNILPKRLNQDLFSDLQVILDNRVKPEHQKTKKQQNKFRALLDKLNRVKKERKYSSSFHEHYKAQDQAVILQQPDNMLSRSKFSKLKSQNELNQWNKLDLSQASQISYRRSSFEEQLKKVEKLTDRNDASLQKYVVMKTQLLKLGFQFQTCNNSKNK